MATVSTVEARNQFSEIINRSAYGKERVILTRRGRGLVAIMPIEDLRLLEEIEDEIDIERACKSLKAAKEKGTVSWKSLKEGAGL